MAKILQIISSPRGKDSYSIKLSDAIVEKLKEKDSSSTVTVKNLTNPLFPQLEETHLTAFFTPVDKHTDENKIAIQHSNEAIAEIMDADILVIGAPMYNFSIPSSLKAWIDHISRAGITFKYTEHGPQGLITGKKAYIAVTSGGIYSEGPYKAANFVSPYLQTILGFLGITDVTFVTAEGFSVPGVQEQALQKAIDSIVV